MALIKLESKHFIELSQSKIDHDIIALNFRSLSGNACYDHLLYSDKLERTNTGKLSYSILKQYQHLDNGGWWCYGSYDSNWGCLKPDKPRVNADNKIIKYEHPPKENTELFMLQVSYRIGYKIAKKNNLGKIYIQRLKDIAKNKNIKVSELLKPIKLSFDNEYNLLIDIDDCELKNDVDFWQWVKLYPKIDIHTTEGAKKTACILSQGYAAIGLSGIWNHADKYDYSDNSFPQGFGDDSQITKKLKPQFEGFVKDRNIVSVFDQDEKIKTQIAVKKAILQFNQLLKRDGVKSFTCCNWYHKLGKGIDDIEFVGDIERILDHPISLNAYLNCYKFDFSKYNCTVINERYCNFKLDLSYKMLGIKAPKGSGKTETMAREIKPLLDLGHKFLILTHRRQLGRELSNRLGVTYVEDLSQDESNGIFGLALCMDSLKPTGQGNINVDDYQDCIIVIDEVEQVLPHLIIGSTCQKSRLSIFETFTAILNICSNIIVSDADLSNISLDYFRHKLDLDRSNIKLYINEYSISKGNCYVMPNQNALLNELQLQITQGKTKHIILTGSQQAKSTYSTKNLEKWVSNINGNLKILRIDSETVADPSHAAYGCIEKFNDVAKNYDIVIASPVIETGISIDIYDYYDAVWQLTFGVQSSNSVLQSMCRLRDFNVPRYIAMARQTTHLKIGNGSTSKKDFKLNNDSNFNLILNNIKSNFESSYLPEYLAFIDYSLESNNDFHNYCENITQKIIDEGFAVLDFCDNDKDNDKALAKALKDNKEVAYEEEIIKTCESRELSENEYNILKNKISKTETERLCEKKYEINNLYSLVNPTIVESHDNGLYSQLNLWFYLTIGNHLLSNRDESKILDLSKENKVFLPDVLKVSLSHRILALKALKLDEMIMVGKVYSKSDLEQWYKDCSLLRKYIQHNFGIILAKEPINAFKQLLNILGYGLKSLGQKRDDNGNRVRQYQVIDTHFEYRYQILEKWLSDREQKYSQTQNVSHDTKVSHISQNIIEITSETESKSKDDHRFDFTHYLNAMRDAIARFKLTAKDVKSMVKKAIVSFTENDFCRLLVNLEVKYG